MKLPFSKIVWIIFGSILLFTLSIFFQAMISPIWHSGHFRLSPFPFLLSSILYFFLGRSETFATLFPLSVILNGLLPLFIFIIGSLNVHKKYFFLTFILLATAFAIYDVVFFYRGWGGGLHYQGLQFLQYSMINAITYFVLIYSLIGAYCMTRRAIFLHMALLLFCVTITSIAFPWLGECM